MLRGLFRKIGGLLTGGRQVDEGLFDELEELLIEADVGPGLAAELVAELRREAESQHITDADALRDLMRSQVATLLRAETGTPEIVPGPTPPSVLLVVGVNGTGKTTTIGKLAHLLRKQGRRVLLAAADTFRAAAIDQLQIWAERARADIVRHQEGSDPGAVAFDAIEAAKARGADWVIIDTAGRLHTKSGLMRELEKVQRVCRRATGRDPEEVLLVLDATTGQNALRQAEVFGEAVGLTGVVVAKLDGTAKGGIVLGIKKRFGIPIRYVGTGEGIDDLAPFSPEEFAHALFE
ncbi:MAG TPA: signal recognition particle-docking protein FtsY [Armatimonadota bacterium]|nr:signal recognition particle-docking protein FtsY [Armatimonadota bacterium]